MGMKQLTLTDIEKKIYLLRGQKIMLDADLAELYGVELKRLNEQVRRNLDRFPEDFMFGCDSSDLTDLKSQFATLGLLTTGIHRKRGTYLAFTENGVAMLSSILNSDQAVQVNIAIIRIFTKLRSFLVLETELRKDMNKLKTENNKMFQTVFERMDSIEEMISPKIDPNRKKIGLN